MLSSSLWETNLRHLKSELQHVSFRDIRQPDETINNRLHDRREKLRALRSLVSETNTYITAGLTEYYDNFPKIVTRHRQTHLSPTAKHQRILNEADKINTFLIETFQLLISSLSIRDSAISIQQPRRATLVTWLAFICVPLSFVTGIFGMNVKEINGSPLYVWTCFAALAVVLSTTAMLFLDY
ncbi:hypothetical protein EJ03DRAFT_87218 [Teratosphaeria nubilosa]|uniref:Cora-domain-containing protein n=1 Tax=Teratosphaeria nubilosa TaxID=161662 RepID=A0A6G1LAW5_9PEZI|nr:hypothetical protein EJ03DRAFT_87218 [Teratosphaeria nubilosa]